jgi:hypothetical protein
MKIRVELTTELSDDARLGIGTHQGFGHGVMATRAACHDLIEQRLKSVAGSIDAEYEKRWAEAEVKRLQAKLQTTLPGILPVEDVDGEAESAAAV